MSAKRLAANIDAVLALVRAGENEAAEAFLLGMRAQASTTPKAAPLRVIDGGLAAGRRRA